MKKELRRCSRILDEARKRAVEDRKREERLFESEQNARKAIRINHIREYAQEIGVKIAD